MSEHELSAEGDPWDDYLLINAYDSAITVVKIEPEEPGITSDQSSASSSNRRGFLSEIKIEPEEPGITSDQSSASSSNRRGFLSEIKGLWKSGMYCRCKYSGDNQDYEAIILWIKWKKNMAKIRYLGFNNEENVPLSSLKPSLGNKARDDQFMKELNAEDDPWDDTLLVKAYDRAITIAKMKIEAEDSDGSSSFSNKRTLRLRDLKNDSSKKSRISDNESRRDIPAGQSIQYAEAEDFMSNPPPPNPNFIYYPNNLLEARNSMLTGWYMNGFYSGYYQGMMRNVHNRNVHNRNVHNRNVRKDQNPRRVPYTCS